MFVLLFADTSFGALPLRLSFVLPFSALGQRGWLFRRLLASRLALIEYELDHYVCQVVGLLTTGGEIQLVVVVVPPLPRLPEPGRCR